MDVIEGYRLSPQQKHLWLLQQEDQKAIYSAWCDVLLQQNIDISQLKIAVENVIQQHEILHTVYRCLPGLDLPLQVISIDDLLAFHIHDLSGLCGTSQIGTLANIERAALQVSFHLEDGPIVRALLVKFAQSQYRLLLFLPALCADTISLHNLVKEISRSYTAHAQGGAQTGEPIETMQYADFAEWQYELLNAEETKPGRDFWHMPDVPTLLNVTYPFERLHANKSRFKAAVLHAHMDTYLLRRAEAFVEQSRTSLFTFFLTCWQALLFGYLRRANMLTGVTFDNRKHEELAHAIGLFAMALPCVCRIDSAMTFRQLLAQVDEQQQNMYKWQEFFCWDTWREILASHGGEPFTKAGFVWSTTAPVQPDIDSFQMTTFNACIDRYTLQLSCVQNAADVSLAFHFDSERISEIAVQCLAEQYTTLVASALSNTDAHVSALNRLSLHHYRQIMTEWAVATTPSASCDLPVKLERCVHHLFEDQVTSTSDSIALVFAEEQLSYGELNQRANQLAYQLQALDVGPESIVGLCMERSLGLIIGLLGILKAGGAYVPLDPTLPAGRIALIAEEAQAHLVVTQERQRDIFVETKTEIVCFDTDIMQLTHSYQDNPQSQVSRANALYVIFTSGSTGRPKGVVVTHANVLNYLVGLRPILDLPAHARYASISTIGADLGNTIIFASLCHSGCLYLLSQEQTVDPTLLAEYCCQHSIDCLKIVPSHVQALLCGEHAAQVLPRQWLILGGETFSWDLLNTVKSLKPASRILNHYGPTETTIGVLTYQVKPDLCMQASASVPLGCPLGRTECYVLDQQGQPLPAWGAGELYIGGAGLSRGYLRKPDLTAERFVPDPFSQRPGGRLYRTGDLVRWQAEGILEFLGRADQQVKIHGYRIELGEIEAVLRQHAQIQDCVVLAREDDAGDRRLMAYVVPSPLARSSAETDSALISMWRHFLEQRLPSYMLPAIFVALETLPLTGNGKVDKSALPVPNIKRQALQASYIAPRTPTEVTLANIWAHVLRVERVGISDNFFTLGGDSILSIQVIARAAHAGLRLTPRQLFQRQTIAELATVATNVSTLEAEQGPIMGPVPLTPVQQRFFAQKLANPHYYNQSLLLTVQQPITLSRLQRVVDQLLTHHDALRLRFVHTEAGWQQYNTGPRVAAPICTHLDLSALPATEQPVVLTRAATACQASLNLESGLLLRAVLFTLEHSQSARLLFVAHHLVVDGISWRILLEDCQLLMSQACDEQPFSLPTKTTSFQQWSRRLEQYAQTETLLQEQHYWLAPARTAVRPLPLDRAEGVQAISSSCSVSVYLSPEETRALLQEAPQAYQTQIQEVLLAALLLACTSRTGPAVAAPGKRHLLVNLEGHGREDLFPEVDLSRTVGWFTSLFPLLLVLEEDESPGAVLKSVKEQIRSIPQHGISYGLLRYLSPFSELRRQLAALPEAEITFNYLGQFDQIFTSGSWLQVAPESSGPSSDEQNARQALLEVNSVIMGGQLLLDWVYSERHHTHATIEALAERFLAALRRLIAHCQSPEAGGYTPSDFPEAELDQNELDRLLIQLDDPSQPYFE